MKINVKEVDGNTQKSKAEIEEQLLQKHEAQQNETPVEEKPEKVETQEVKEETKVEEPEKETPPVEDKTPSSELNDEHVLNFIKERYNKDINSVDELFETKESNVELPDDVKLYFDYKKETGRGIEDFYKLQKNYDDMDADSVLADYYGVQEEGLDAIDIQDIMEDKFSFDEEEDDPKDIKKKKLAKKRQQEAIAANSYLKAEDNIIKSKMVNQLNVSSMLTNDIVFYTDEKGVKQKYDFTFDEKDTLDEKGNRKPNIILIKRQTSGALEFDFTDEQNEQVEDFLRLNLRSKISTSEEAKTAGIKSYSPSRPSSDTASLRNEQLNKRAYAEFERRLNELREKKNPPTKLNPSGGPTTRDLRQFASDYGVEFSEESQVIEVTQDGETKEKTINVYKIEGEEFPASNTIAELIEIIGAKASDRKEDLVTGYERKQGQIENEGAGASTPAP